MLHRVLRAPTAGRVAALARLGPRAARSYSTEAMEDGYEATYSLQLSEEQHALKELAAAASASAASRASSSVRSLHMAAPAS